jgi:hypothetical protein
MGGFKRGVVDMAAMLAEYEAKITQLNNHQVPTTIFPDKLPGPSPPPCQLIVMPWLG